MYLCAIQHLLLPLPGFIMILSTSYTSLYSMPALPPGPDNDMRSGTPKQDLYKQCSKLRFYFVHSSGAHILKLCTLEFSCALLSYIAMRIEWKKNCTSGAHVRQTSAQLLKCTRRAPCAPLISNTEKIYLIVREQMNSQFNVVLTLNASLLPV